MEVTLTDANFSQEILKYEGVALVDFWAPWCGPCQMMGPIIKELSEDLTGKVKVGKLSVDDNPETAQKYNIMSIPTFIIFKNGEPVDQFSGAQTKEALRERLDQQLQ